MTTSTRCPRRVLGSLALALALSVLLPGSRPSAQSTALGTFRWQLRPYCNVVSLTVTPQGAEFQVDGTDDQCGASQQAAAVGRAFPNPDGSIGLGFTIVTTPGGTPVHVDATITLPSISGTWRDSTGLSGSFVFTPGAAASGQRRPVPASGLPPAAITGASFAPGSIPVTALAPGVASAALSAIPACAADEYSRGVDASGQLVCTAIRPPSSRNLSGYEAFQTKLIIGSDGWPFIVRLDTISGRYVATHCVSADCSSGITSTVLPDAGPHSAIDLELDPAGRPAVIFRANGERLLRCGDLACTTGHQLSPVLSTSSTAVAFTPGGLPVVADPQGVTFCGSPACATGNTVVPGSPAGVPLRLWRRPDQRFVLWTAAASDTLVRQVCDPAGCQSAQAAGQGATGWLAYASGGFARSQLLTRPDGTLAGASAAGRNLEVVWCDSPDCATAAATALPLPAPAFDTDASIAIGVDGLPVVAYWRWQSGELMVAHCARVDCSVVTAVTRVDVTFDVVGQFASIGIGSDGYPVIAHRNVYAERMRVTKCWNRTCR